MTHESEERYILSSVDSALSIMSLFYDYEELTTNEIAKLVGISRSTAFRFMVTLEHRGFVTKTGRSTYRLGLSLFSLGLLAYNRMELTNMVHPLLVKMAEASGETCHLSIMEDDTHILYIDRAVGTSWLRMNTLLGYRQIAHCTASGKAILSHRSDAKLNQYLRLTTFEALTPNSIRDAKELLAILDEAKANGYACDNEEAERGLTCFARPLLDSGGHAYAAVSVSGPTTRMLENKEAHLARLEQLVNALAAKIA